VTHNTTKEYRKIWSVLIHVERYTQDTKLAGNLPIIKGEYYPSVNQYDSYGKLQKPVSSMLAGFFYYLEGC